MLRKVFDVLANMGVWIRLNDPRHEPVSDEGRAWGPARDGFALSIKELNSDTISVLIKNVGIEDKSVRIPGWLGFYRVSLTGPGGMQVRLRPYGRQLLGEAQNDAMSERLFPAGKSLATEIPVAVLYDLSQPGNYSVSVSSPIPDRADNGDLDSNEIILSR